MWFKKTLTQKKQSNYLESAKELTKYLFVLSINLIIVLEKFSHYTWDPNIVEVILYRFLTLSDICGIKSKEKGLSDTWRIVDDNDFV